MLFQQFKEVKFNLIPKNQLMDFSNTCNYSEYVVNFVCDVISSVT